MSKPNENVTPCDKDVNKNHLKHTSSLYSFRHKRKLMWLSYELDFHHPAHCLW